MEKSLAFTSPTIEELAAKNAELEKQNEALQAKLKWLEEQFCLSQQQKFGASSEKTNPDQFALFLFNEAEVTVDEKVKEATLETIHYCLSDKEQTCLCCGEQVSHVYSYGNCERTETPNVTAKMPAPMYPGSLASPSAIGYIMNQNLHTQLLR